MKHAIRFPNAVKIAATLVLGAAVLIFVIGSTYQRAAADEENPSANAADASAVRVEVGEPTKRSMERELRMPGSLEAYERADLYAKTSGYVSEVRVDIGHRVGAGEILLTIDVPEMIDELAQFEAELQAKEAALAQARARLETARAEVRRRRAEYDLGKITRDRKKRLFEEKAIPHQELDEAQSHLSVAEAQTKIAESLVASREADIVAAEAAVTLAEAGVARIKTLMEYATIRAPMDGVITQRFVHPGAFVRSAEEGETTPLLSIARTDKLRLRLAIPESDASFVRIDTPVKVNIPALKQGMIDTSVTRIARALRTQTRTMSAEIDLANDEGRLAPGMYAQAAIMLEYRAQALMIPSKAIHARGRALTVYVADGDVARAQPVKIGYDDGAWAEVLDGLHEGEQIVLTASSVLAPGAPIRVAKSR